MVPGELAAVYGIVELMIMVMLLGGIVLEWLLYIVSILWQNRRAYVAVLIAVTGFTTTLLVLLEPRPLYLFLALVSVFRIINLLRVAEGRMHAAYLLGTTRRTGLVLGAVQVGLLILGIHLHVDYQQLFEAMAILQVMVAVGVVVIVIRNIYKTRYKAPTEHFADRDLPTVTVAIPARNETADLEACLQSVIANPYPKLEILVLDDCSQDKTAEVIRSFAQEGVRFVKGQPPEERWLAKNQAYNKLTDEASGKFIIFCGVDVRFGPNAIKALVETMLVRKKDMISILPVRTGNDVSAAFIQPMRYWWELALPRRYFNRPPVLSTCWVINRAKLKKLGGFEAVRHAVIPEGFFARELVKTDGYSFLRAGNDLDVETKKSMADQQETALRMQYPQVRRRPEWVLLLLVVQLLLVFGSFVLALSGIWAELGMSQVLALLASILLVLTHVLIVQVSNPANTLVALVNLPAAILTEVVLGMMSMFKYEFSEVDWRGRNICIPVMHVIPRLPDIKS